ncbi:MAG: dihydrolipoyl dehydrogenase [Thermoproteota archaeon]
MVSDAVIIGGGPAGYVAAIKIAQLGGRPTLIEKDKLGGVCANLGCIPTKVMHASIKYLEQLKRAENLNLKIKIPSQPQGESINFSEILRRRRRAVEISVKGIEKLLESYGIPVIWGEAKVVSNTSVEVNTKGQKKRIETKNVVIATGSLPQELESLRPDGYRILTSDDILALDSPPESLAIVGGGIIGVEFATIFNALGTKITILEKMERVLPSEDWEISDFMRKRMSRAGIEVITGCQIGGAGKDGLEVKTEDGTKKIRSEKILVAVGRKPRINAEEFSKLGVRFTARGISVDPRMETNVKGIYAIGDVTGPPYLAHVAFTEGIVCAQNIMGREAKIDLSKVPSCIYSIPEAASFGVRNSRREEDRNFKVGRSNFASNAEARALGETEGFVKVLIYRESDTLVGAHAVGPSVTEIIATATVAATLGANTVKLKECIIAHPTMTETLLEAIRDADREAIHSLREDS